VDGFPAFDVDAYLRFDVRLGRQGTDSLQLSLVGQNLFEEHQE